MKRRAALKAYARVLELVSIVVGLGLIASCATVGFTSGGARGGLLSFVLACGVAALLVGAVFLLTTMSSDVMDLRSRTDVETRSSGPPRDQERP